MSHEIDPLAGVLRNQRFRDYTRQRQYGTGDILLDNRIIFFGCSGSSIFEPIINDPRSMNALIFELGPMGLEQLLLGLSLSERITYDQERNTIFINFEGFQVRTTADVDLVRSEMEARCKAIGRKVALVANYDGFYLDPMVSDAYFSMITYMQNRYYSSASRYTTSAFMRLKLGAGLAERNLAPHVFETWPEAQAFSAAQPRS